MALWLLACKEDNGQLFVSRIPRAIDTKTPGIPSIWYYVGPGTNPKIQEYVGNQFILVFNYLSHLTCRVFDIGNWPPTEVDPIQITPGNPNIAIQQPQETLLFNAYSFSTKSVIQECPLPPQIQATPVTVNGTQYSVTITTVPSYIPGTDPHWYRVYRKPMNGSNWSLVMDWQPPNLDNFSALNFTDTATGSLQFDYRATLGLSFNRTNPNDATQHFEGEPGNIVPANSALYPQYYAPQINEPINAPYDNAQTMAFSSFGTRQIFYVDSQSDTVDFKGSNGAVTWGDLGARQPNVVLSVATPWLTPPSDVLSFSFLNSRTANATVSARSN